MWISFFQSHGIANGAMALLEISHGLIVYLCSTCLQRVVQFFSIWLPTVSTCLSVVSSYCHCPSVFRIILAAVAFILQLLRTCSPWLPFVSQSFPVCVFSLAPIGLPLVSHCFFICFPLLLNLFSTCLPACLAPARGLSLGFWSRSAPISF